MEPVTVLTFNDRETAEPVTHKLEQTGIPAIIYDESKVQKLWFIREPLAHIRVRVDRKDYERARQLVRQWHDMPELRDALHCPDCGSSRVEYPQFTRKFVLPGFGALLCLMGLMDREFYCQECQYTWPTKVSVPPRLDALGWPRKAVAPKHH